MRIVLAGFNVDKEVLDELKRHAPERRDVTPETISASYARISRDARPADALRRAAREEVEKARRSNRTIIFKMGHHSVAEHAVFNFDLIGVSRLAIEEIERFRLCSFTEKSQRYIALGDDFVIPEEIRAAGKETIFVRTVRAQNALYHKLCRKLRPYVFGRHPDLAQDPRAHGLLDGWVKEDARYAVSLATEGQLGLTINARNLEALIRRFAAKDSAELKDLGRRLHALAKEIAPSLILFTEANDFDAKTYPELAAWTGPFPRRMSGRPRAVDLVEFPPDGDEKILTSLLHSISGLSYRDCRARVKRMSPPKKKDFAKRALERMEFYDVPPREFEYADLTFDLVLSASCFAQLKRHRMATLTCPGYDPGLGVTLPSSIESVGAREEFLTMVERTNQVHAALKTRVGAAADYILTNAHRRRVLLKVNLRELYHISRLREDATAQWDIRALSAEMATQARKVMPYACLLLGGKDAYPDVYRRIFGRGPKAIPPIS